MIFRSLFTIQTDASDLAVASVLFQLIDECERVIGYFSKKISDSVVCGKVFIDLPADKYTQNENMMKTNTGSSSASIPKTEKPHKPISQPV